ncbi:MAG: tetratricopeptide repeat protein [Rhodocyclaceae bacterium]|nr:tetratricopeptide repeat protein [Rhodocyclaceae bacterium]
MSLLLDALKRAEAAKRHEQAAHTGIVAPAGDMATSPAGSSSAVRIEGRTSPTPPASPAASVTAAEMPADRLDLLPMDAEEGADAAPGRRSWASEAAGEAERLAAQNLFSAKSAPSRPALLYPAIAGLIGALAIGIWFWWQWPALSAPASTAAPAMAPKPMAAPAGAMVPPLVAVQPITAASQLAAARALDQAPNAHAGDTRKPLDPSPAPPAERTSVLREQLSEQKPPSTDMVLRPQIRSRRSPEQVLPEVARAYEALLAGDGATAKRAYDEALAIDPLNRDALHGLAAIALAEQRLRDAEAAYRRLVEIDPGDARAQAALLSLRSSDDKPREARLRELIAQQPRAATPHFVLANLLAARGQWREAQEHYFQAYSADPDNPDHRFNLAVSLDQLRQYELAIRYYREALAAAERTPHAFPVQQAATRIQTLSELVRTRSTPP